MAKMVECIMGQIMGGIVSFSIHIKNVNMNVLQMKKLALAIDQIRVANEKSLLEARIQEAQLQKKRDEERIMTRDLTAMPDDQKKYYMCLRAKIRSRFSMPST
jgi:hypothetical protein